MKRLISPLLVLLLLLAFAGTVAGHDAIASCGTIQLVNGTPTADITRTDLDPDVLVRDNIPGTGTQTGLAAGTYQIQWDDGFTVIGKVVTACEQLTEPTPTPTPVLTPTPPQRIPCTSNPAVFGPPCPEPTTSPTPSPTPTPTTSPSPSSSPSPTPNLSVTPSPDVPTITLPPTDGTIPDSGSAPAVGIVFTILSVLCLTVLLWPKKAR